MDLLNYNIIQQEDNINKGVYFFLMQSSPMLLLCLSLLAPGLCSPFLPPEFSSLLQAGATVIGGGSTGTGVTGGIGVGTGGGLGGAGIGTGLGTAGTGIGINNNNGTFT